ncbi:MAG: hypothetical protein PHD73_01840 [Sediminibacterium sp.]|nr:hypothetical protein [Sediminibacterium sp.]
MSKLESLKKHIQPGQVYRRSDLAEWSNAVDRHLSMLLADGTLKKLSGGLYYALKPTVFGNAPAEDHELVQAFLKDNRFVITSPNDYNKLGVGTTQLYNTRLVYNYKRHGEFKLGNRTFRFVRKPYVPEKITKEFLLVDLVNNRNELAEDQPNLMDNVKREAKQMDTVQLKRLANQFGKVGTRKFFTEALAN